MSWIPKEYMLHTGEAGRDSYNNGTAIPVIDALIYWKFGWNYVLRSVRNRYSDGEWMLVAVVDIAGLSAEEVSELDQFMNGSNNTVIGIYPPRLIDPPIDFDHVAYANEELKIVREDLVGRGLGRQLSFYKGDQFEYWSDEAYSAGQKNQVANMWKERIRDAKTDKPL